MRATVEIPRQSLTFEPCDENILVGMSKFTSIQDNTIIVLIYCTTLIQSLGESTILLESKPLQLFNSIVRYRYVLLQTALQY